MGKTQVDVAFMVAMSEEIDGIFDLERWSEAQAEPYGVREYRGGPVSAVVVHTGIGTTNAAAAAQHALDLYDPRRVVNMGLVGCLNPAIEIGGVHAVTACAFFDVDATAFGYRIGQIPRTAVTEYELKSRVPKVPQAKLISGDTFVTDPGVFHPDLELAAIAHTLFRHELLDRLESYKAPSDYCDDESTGAFDLNMPKALANLAAVAGGILRGEPDVTACP
jgi:adenosylhomocysteine nucleosidase